MAIDDIIEHFDVPMLLRVQHEGHDGMAGFSKKEYQKSLA